MRNYDKLAINHGYSSEALGWGKKDRRELRFEILSNRWNLENCNILDVGCGFGDFGAHLISKFKNIKYVGIDQSEQIVNIANAKFPQLDVRNKNLKDFSESSLKFDFVFASGIFNDKRLFHWHKLKKELLMIRDLSLKGFGFNFLTSNNEFKDSGVQYTSPSNLIREMYKFTNNIVLRNDYMPYEASIFVDLHTQVDTSLTIYNKMD